MSLGFFVEFEFEVLPVDDDDEGDDDDDEEGEEVKRSRHMIVSRCDWLVQIRYVFAFVRAKVQDMIGMNVMLLAEEDGEEEAGEQAK